MGNPREIVYIDTMIVFEAHRANCWASLNAQYSREFLSAEKTKILMGR